VTRAPLVVFALLVPALAPAAAQAPENTVDLAIFVRGYTTAANGAETASGVTYDALAIPGQTATGTMGARGCGYFAASSKDGALDKAEVGWRLEITPTRVEDRTVTLGLRWSRVIDLLSDSKTTPPSGDMQLTLKLGESRPLDSIRVRRDAKTLDGKPCDKSQATLRVGIDPYPIEQYDRRLIATDVWLVERLTGGKERTELASLRSLPNRSASFYFDSIRGRETSLDIYGHLLASLDGDAIDLAIETVSRWDSKPPAYPYRWLRSTVRVQPGEVVDVPLPKLGNEAGSFGDRSFALRVRARRIR
jgi:hypothetical protein